MSEGTFHYEQRRVENDLVALEIFDPSVHVALFVEVVKTNPEILTYIDFPPTETEADFMKVYDKGVRSSLEDCLYAVIDKVPTSGEAKPSGRYAGVISLMATNPVNAVTEMGIIIFPEFQRTHVAANAIGLILLYTLDPPSAGGLGLRRVEWQCHTENALSRRTALRMGFEFEGIARWQRVFPLGKAALPAEALAKRNGTERELPGRHTAVFSIVWDEWDEKREKVVARMGRKQ